MPKLKPFASWDDGIYKLGCEMGIRHANTGDCADMSDERCVPLETERDNAAGQYPFGQLRASFYGGYDAGYQSVMDAVRDNS